MTLTQLSYIVTLAEVGHFGRAAEACFVTQPTLSMQIKRLEAELGVALFDRGSQPIRPTQRGEQVLAQARAVLAERDRLFALLDEEGPLVGQLRVGIIPTLSTYLLPLLAPELERRYPRIELWVEELTTEHLVDQLVAGRLDSGLVATDEERGGLEEEVLFTEAFACYVNESSPLAALDQLRPKDLDREDLWLLAEGHCLRDQVVQLCQQTRESGGRNLRFASGSLETLRHLVDRSGGLTLLPQLALQYLAEPALHRIRRFEDPVPARTVRLVRPRAGLKERLTDALAEVVVASVSPHLNTGALATQGA